MLVQDLQFNSVAALQSALTQEIDFFIDLFFGNFKVILFFVQVTVG